MARYGIWRPLPQVTRGVKKWDYGRAVSPRAVFVHVMEGNLSGTDAWFRNPASGTVSTHFGIGHASWFDRSIGRVSVFQWVDTANCAYGTAITRNPVSELARNVLGSLIGRMDINHAIIHIEVEGYPTARWPSGFVTALNNLLKALAVHGPLVVMRHNDVSSKTCPGTATPWNAIRPSYGQRLGSVPNTSTSTRITWNREMRSIGTPYIRVSPGGNIVGTAKYGQLFATKQLERAGPRYADWRDGRSRRDWLILRDGRSIAKAFAVTNRIL